MNDAQQIFAVFYAIFWGGVFSVSARWKPFNFGAIFDKEVKNVTKRISLALLILNVLPILYFVIIFYCLKTNPFKGECWINISAMVLSGIIPAFGIFGFYRLWLGIIEKDPSKYYLDKCSIPSRYHSRHELENQPEPSLEELNILRSRKFSCRKNMIVGFVYILLPGLGAKQPYPIICITILMVIACVYWSYSDNIFIDIVTLFAIFGFVFFIVNYLILLIIIILAITTAYLILCECLDKIPIEIKTIIYLLIIFIIIYRYPS